MVFGLNTEIWSVPRVGILVILIVRYQGLKKIWAPSLAPGGDFDQLIFFPTGGWRILIFFRKEMSKSPPHARPPTLSLGLNIDRCINHSFVRLFAGLLCSLSCSCHFMRSLTSTYVSHICRTCVNGKLVEEKTLLKHGDRILWGNNHYFRINCPRLSGERIRCLLYNMIDCNASSIDFLFHCGALTKEGWF